MSSKPILDLLAYCRTGDGPCAEALAEFRRLLAEEPASLSEEDLLALERLGPDALPRGLEDWEAVWPAASGIASAAAEELLRRDELLREAAAAPAPDVRRVVGSVLGPAPAREAPAGRRTRLWWLGSQALADCSVPELAALAGLPGAEPENEAVIEQAREELLGRGYRPPAREDDAGEHFRYLRGPYFRDGSVWVSDRRVSLAGRKISSAELAAFRIDRVLVPSLRTIGTWVLLLAFLAPAALCWWRNGNLWIVVVYSLMVPPILVLASRSPSGYELPWLPGGHRLTVRTRSGEVHRVTLENEQIHDLRDALARLLAEASLPPAAPDRSDA
jgi:hypothetical protein